MKTNTAVVLVILVVYGSSEEQGERTFSFQNICQLGVRIMLLAVTSSFTCRDEAHVEQPQRSYEDHHNRS